MTSLPAYLSGFPKTANLRDGRQVTLRPMTREDGPALLTMFQRFPAGDRFFLRDDVVSPNVIRHWTDELDYDRVVPILGVEEGGRVVADFTLHRSHHPARSHVAEVRFTVDPEYRNQGLASRLTEELLQIAHQAGIRKVMLELVAIGEEPAIRAAERWGFRQIARLLDQVQDQQGLTFDLVLLERDLTNWERSVHPTG